MSLSPTPTQATYAYALLNAETTPPTVLAVKLSRQECRDYRKSLEQSGSTIKRFDIRRGKLRLFDR